MAKNFWESKTFWINLLVVVFMVLEGFGVIDVLPDTASIEQWAAITISVVNIILRFMTTKPVKMF